MPLYRYRCSNGHEAELLRPMRVSGVVCHCGDVGLRQAVNPLAVIGKAGVPRDQRSYRKSYGEYREAVAEVADHYERVNGERAPRDHVQEPDYYGLAERQAIAKGAPILGG